MQLHLCSGQLTGLFIFSVVLTSLFLSAQPLNPLSSPHWHPATATWYGNPEGDGSDVDVRPFRARVGAVSPILFKDGEGCGACYKVKCLDKGICSRRAVTVIVTDLCGGTCSSGGGTHFDLSGAAFGRMAIAGNSARLRNRGEMSVIFRRIENRELVEGWGLSVEWRQKLFRWVSWQPLIHGWVCLNTYGSITTKRGGYGAIIRDDCGNAIIAVAGSLVHDSVIFVELLAIKRGLESCFRTPCKYPGKNVAFNVNKGSTDYWLALLVEFEGGDGDIGSMHIKEKFAKDNDCLFEFDASGFVVKERITGKMLFHDKTKNGLYHLSVSGHHIQPSSSPRVFIGVSYTLSQSGRPAIFARDPDANALDFTQVDN
ncbi:hypothetical protein HHK36_001898 [Tetracentron sinense]|uniref:Expansin-like EG45 domain-containing protein n=1 Tax=Tetracentron sinense TaxID=13715 RepID=A0A835A4J8_TETSI|nr:hypothetical protein HHK36_001898 [Tetracentron sinense]